MTGDFAQRIGRLAAAAIESAEVHKGDIEARNIAIRQADAAGAKLRELHEWSGLSVGQLARIVAEPQG
jgi:hypothetical protein